MIWQVTVAFQQQVDIASSTESSMASNLRRMTTANRNILDGSRLFALGFRREGAPDDVYELAVRIIQSS